MVSSILVELSTESLYYYAKSAPKYIRIDRIINDAVKKYLIIKEESPKKPPKQPGKNLHYFWKVGIVGFIVSLTALLMDLGGGLALIMVIIF